MGLGREVWWIGKVWLINWGCWIDGSLVGVNGGCLVERQMNSGG